MLVVIAAGATALAWRVVADDRALVNERERIRLEQSSDVVVAELRGAWTAIDAALTARLAGRDVDIEAVTSAVSLVRCTTQCDVDPPDRVAFLHFSDEFRPDDPEAARLLAEAASLRARGRDEDALGVYAELAESPGVVMNAPSAVVAHHARAMAFKAIGRDDDFRLATVGLADALGTHTTLLTAGVYRFYADEIARWVGQTDPLPQMVLREARAELVSRLWQRRRDAGGLRSAFVEWIGDRPFTVLAWSSDDALAVAVGDPGLPTALVDRSAAPIVNVAFADATGRLMAGAPPSATGTYMTRAAVGTGLPWTVHVSTGPAWVAESVSGRTRALAWSIAIAAMAVLVGGAFMARSMGRELELVRIKSDFVAAVSHELRTPLAAVRQVTELLADGRVRDESERDDYYRRLGHASGRLNRLVEDLLDFKRLEAGRLDYTFTSVDPAELVGNVVDDVRGTTPSTPIALNAPGTGLKVRADREALGRAVRNLLDNAIKYSPAGSPVDVSVKAASGRVAMAVRDRGPGIPADRQQSVFDTFARGPSAEGVPGTGLGLTMVRHIVDAHGGTVTLDSQLGGGSTFVIEVPINPSNFELRGSKVSQR